MFEVLGIVVCCVVVADFLTGLIHWLEDTYGLPTWPIVGPLVIQPNIFHHARPGKIGTNSTFYSRNFQSFSLAAFVCFCVWLLGFFSWPFALVAFLAAFGNEVHTWNHRARNPRFVSWLHDAGLIQSKAHHAKHHHAPYAVNFCTLTNFTNAALEAIQFWRILESTIAIVFRIRPKRGTAERQGF